MTKPVAPGEWIKSTYDGRWFYNSACEWMGEDLEEDCEPCFAPSETHLIFDPDADATEAYGRPRICKDHWPLYVKAYSPRWLTIIY